MAAHDYQFVTRWRLPGTVEEVSQVLEDVESLPRWWPAVYLDVKVVDPGRQGGVGRKVELHTRGRLPYTLRWSFRVIESHPPQGYVLEADGDLVGRGEWRLHQDGGEVDVVYDWRIRADKPLLRALSFALRPLFAWNHQWAMAKGEQSLRAELSRRREVRAGAS